MVKSLHIKNDIHQLTELRSFLDEVAVEFALEQSLIPKLFLALEEAVTNVILYAYPKETGRDIDILIEKKEQSLHISIIDSGVPFDPMSKATPDISLSAEERPIGGLGIYLVKQMMTKLEYNRIGGKNILTMIKQLS